MFLNCYPFVQLYIDHNKYIFLPFNIFVPLYFCPILHVFLPSYIFALFTNILGGYYSPSDETGKDCGQLFVVHSVPTIFTPWFDELIWNLLCSFLWRIKCSMSFIKSDHQMMKTLNLNDSFLFTGRIFSFEKKNSPYIVYFCFAYETLSECLLQRKK